MRKPYPADVSDKEWAFVAPYLSLLPEDVSQRVYPLREVFNGMRYILKTGAPWRWMPNDLPPWEIVYQQTQRNAKGKWVCSRRWCMTCVCCCASAREKTRAHRCYLRQPNAAIDAGEQCPGGLRWRQKAQRQQGSSGK
jgi:transposase